MDSDFSVPFPAPAHLEPTLIRRPDGSLATEHYVDAARLIRAEAMRQWLDGLAAWARAKAIPTDAIPRGAAILPDRCADPTGA